MINSLIFYYLEEREVIGFILAFFSMVFEGDVLLFTFGFLTSLDYFKIENIFIALFSGTIVGDVGWYLLGNKIKKPWRWLNFFLKHINQHLDDQLLNRTFRTLFFSKFIYGLHHLVWVRAGILKLDIRKLVEIDLVVSFIWIILVGGVGYLSGSYFSIIRQYLKFVEVGLLVSLIIFFTIERVIIKYGLKKRI